VSTFYGTGTHRLIYKAESFATGLTVTAYIWNASLTKSALQTFTESSDGLYYLDYNFVAAGTHFGKFYEGGTGITSGSFRVIASPAPVNTIQISGSADAANKLEASAETMVIGAAIAGTLSSSQMTTDLTELTNDHYNGRIIIWTSGALSAQATDITDYDGASKMLTFTEVTEAPAEDDEFVIV
jgi:hypothetical protein